MDKLQRFFTDNWAVRETDFQSLLTLIAPCVVNGSLNVASDLIDKNKCKALAVALPDLAEPYELNRTDLPENSVALIEMSGMLYSWETDWMVEQIHKAERNPAIAGIVLAIDGPGGMTAHIDQGAAAIKNCTKPVAAVVTGNMCSAHFWLGTSARRTFIVSDMCTVGSVGVMITYTSFRKYLESVGIKLFEIYPDSADLKNKEVRALEDGDDSLIKERAAKIHKIFSDTVAGNLGIAYNPALPLFRGETFSGSEAVNLKYIDQMGDIADAAKWVLAQSMIGQFNNN